MTRDESHDIYQLLLVAAGRDATIITGNLDAADWLAVITTLY